MHMFFKKYVKDFTSTNEEHAQTSGLRSVRVQSKRTRRGFTLIELLVVIAIIGILSSVVLASLNTARLKSRDARRLADVKQIQNALALYFDNNSGYPADIYAPGVLAPTFMASIPKDPVGQTNYSYAGLDTDTDAATCESYHLGVVLEEGTNQSLKGDIDATPITECTGSAVDFDGTSVGVSQACTATAGTPQGTAGADEACYDQRP